VCILAYCTQGEGSHFWDNKCRGSINAIAGPICDLKLLWSPWIERSWISLRRTACISGAAEGTGIRLASVYRSQTCAQVGSKVSYSFHLTHFSGCEAIFQGLMPGGWQFREQQRPLTLWNANHLLPGKNVSSWK